MDIGKLWPSRKMECPLMTRCCHKRLRYYAVVTEELLKRRIETLSGDFTQRDNAIALLLALEGTVLAEIDPLDIELNPYTSAVCFYWLAGGEWDDVTVEVYPDQFETYLSRDRELRINHWPTEPKSSAIRNVIGELLAGME
jgi:hypothetical protein